MSTPASTPPASAGAPSTRRAAPPPPSVSTRTPFLQGMLAGSLLTAIATGLLVLLVWRPEPAPMVVHAPPTHAPTAIPTLPPLVVHMTGAVMQPGLYTLTAPARMKDAIDAAGGLAQDADAGQVNLALPLADGMQFQIPYIGESALLPMLPDLPKTGAIFLGPISLNSATLEQLMELPGIGETKAQAIVAGRPYRSVDDLERVTGIGEKTIEQLRPLVTAP